MMTDKIVEEIPLFPLGRVLFPGSHMALQIFEQRYLDMVAKQMKSGVPFGVVLLQQGSETGKASRHSVVGTSANIVDFDQNERGLLHIDVRGEAVFRVHDTWSESDGLLKGEVEWLKVPVDRSLADSELELGQLLEKFSEHPSVTLELPEGATDSAAFVANRLPELLPITEIDKQKLLEMQSYDDRMAAIVAILQALS